MSKNDNFFIIDKNGLVTTTPAAIPRRGLRD
jgi:hypothetical protein